MPLELVTFAQLGLKNPRRVILNITNNSYLRGFNLAPTLIEHGKILDDLATQSPTGFIYAVFWNELEEVPMNTLRKWDIAQAERSPVIEDEQDVDMTQPVALLRIA